MNQVIALGFFNFNIFTLDNSKEFSKNDIIDMPSYFYSFQIFIFK